MSLEKGGYGLQATRDRLELAYPNSYQLNIKKESNLYRVNLELNTYESNNY